MPRFPPHALASEPAITTAVTEAKKLCVVCFLLKIQRRTRKKTIAAAVFFFSLPHLLMLLAAEVQRCFAFLLSLRGQRSSLQARVPKGGRKACCFERTRLETNEKKRRSRAHHPPPSPPLFDKKLTSSWPFVAGLAFSGAIFFKIATSVTGEW